MLDVREYWDFSDVVGTRGKFESLLLTLRSRPEQIEVVAQIARTWSLPGENPKCLDVLGTVWDEALRLGGRAQNSCMIEAGRAYRGLGMLEKARQGFEDVAHSSHEDLAIDALHMLALISEGEEVERHNQAALKLCLESDQLWARRWVGSIYNNLGWSRFEAGRIEEALEFFHKGVAARFEFGQLDRVESARWCVGHTLCRLGRLDEARELRKEMAPDEGELSDQALEMVFSD